MTADGTHSISSTTSSEPVRLALAYSDALDRCIQSGGANIDEVMDFFADDAVRTVVGGKSQIGKEAIRESFLRRGEQYQQVVELKGIDLWGDLVICRVKRRDTTFTRQGGTHNLRILLVKEGKITRLIVVQDAEEQARMHVAKHPISE